MLTWLTLKQSVVILKQSVATWNFERKNKLRTSKTTLRTSKTMLRTSKTMLRTRKVYRRQYVFEKKIENFSFKNILPPKKPSSHAFFFVEKKQCVRK